METFSQTASWGGRLLLLSWKATAWAKETQGHRGHGQKLLLMVLADYHNTELDQAWPSQATLARDCEMPERTVRYELSKLESAGFITTLRKGNQYQPTLYRLNFTVTAPIYEPAISEPATIAGASEPAISDIVNRQSHASEPARVVPNLLTNLQEPPIEPPVYVHTAQIENDDSEVWPDWYATLYAIKGFKVPLAQARAWLDRQSLSGATPGSREEHAAITAYALKSKWPGDPKRPYTDPWATFQNWVKRPALPQAGQYPKDMLGRLKELEHGASRGRPIRSL